MPANIVSASVAVGDDNSAAQAFLDSAQEFDVFESVDGDLRDSILNSFGQLNVSGAQHSDRLMVSDPMSSSLHAASGGGGGGSDLDGLEPPPRSMPHGQGGEGRHGGAGPSGLHSGGHGGSGGLGAGPRDGPSPRRDVKPRGQGYRKLWQQVTKVSKGQRLQDNMGLAFSDMTVEDLLRIVLKLAPQESAIDAVSQGLYYLDSSALAALLKELSKQGHLKRSVEIFDWLRSLEPSHELAGLCDL